MPINGDISGLPTGGSAEGNLPVPHPLVVTRLAEAWFELMQRDEDKAVAVPGTRWRASDAGFCARSVAYSIDRRDKIQQLILAEQGKVDVDVATAEWQLEQTEPTNPPSIADAWRMGLGTMVHEQLQDVLGELAMGDDSTVNVEVKVDFRPDVDGSGHVDIVIRRPMTKAEQLATGLTKDTYTIVVELKTINGFGFKRAAINFKGNAEGPKSGHVLQGAVAASNLKADLLIIGYLSLECLSPDVAQRNGIEDEIGRFAAEWHFTPDEFEPLAEAEMMRVQTVLDILDQYGPARVPRQIPELPPRARVTNPTTGLWAVEDPDKRIIMSDNTWQCAYCRWRDRCIADG